jgi:TM2 domain-containing membrane protein YozV
MSEAACPYCRMAFTESGPARIFCTACGTPHHEDCYLENGGCTVFGCKRAPADDPKLQVSQSDLRSVSVPSQTGAAAAPAFSGVSPGPTPQALPYGYVQGQPHAPGYSPGVPAGAYYRAPKSRSTFIVLGVFLGALGIHNFYGGYTGRAVGQLCLTVLTLGYLGVIAWLWAIIEICIVTQDSTGLEFS